MTSGITGATRLWGVSVIALTGAISASGVGMSASAQESAQAASDTFELEEIIVTAQKRSQSLQDVAIAVSAFDINTLERQAIDDALDIQYSIPNAILTGNDRFTLRGIGNNAISSTADNGVGLHINGAFIGNPAGEYFDLERIEVLRGPQGTLYGRNTTGGALNLITHKPEEDFGGFLYAQYGNFDALKVRGALNVPVNDVLSQRFAFFYLDRDGWTDNVFTGRNIDDTGNYALRSTTQLKLNEDTDATLVLGYYEEDSTRARENKRLCVADPVLGCSPNELGFDSPDSNATVFQSLLNLSNAISGFTLFEPGSLIYDGAINPENLRQVAVDTDPRFVAEQFYATLEFNHRFGDYTFTSTTGFVDGDSSASTDYDNAVSDFRFSNPITYLIGPGGETTTTDRLITTDRFATSGRTWTEEVRLTSDRGTGFDFTIGAFYLNSKNSASFEIYHPALELAAQAFGLGPESFFFINETPEARTEAWAVFGEGYFEVSERTNITVGLRWSDEEKSIRTRSILLSPPSDFTEASRDWGRLTGKLAIDHRPDWSWTDDTLLYASFAHGFKGGGLNPGNAVDPDFAPETVNSFEVGMKNTFSGGRLQANLAAFYYDYNDLQLAQRIGGNAVTTNADAQIWGVEAEFVWAPTDRIRIDGNASHLNTDIGDFLTVDAANPAQSLLVNTPEVAVNLNGNRLPHSPDWSVKLGAQYALLIAASGWEAIARIDYYWQDTYFTREFNTPNDRIEGWNVTDLQLVFDNDDQGLRFLMFVKNLENNDNITNSIIEDAQVGSYRNVRILEPRTYGVAVQFDF